MKIAMIGPFALAPKGTASARALPMAQALVERNHQVFLYLAPYDNLAHAGRTETRGDVLIHNLNLRRVRAWTPLLSAWRLASLARQLQPDVVHVFKPVGYAALAGMILHSTTRLPIVVDTDDWEGTGGWNSVNPYPWHWRRFFDFQERWLPRHAAAVTVASRTLESQVWGMGVPPDRVFYAPNCPRASLLSAKENVSEAEQADVRERLGIGSEGPLRYATPQTEDREMPPHYCSSLLTWRNSRLQKRPAPLGRPSLLQYQVSLPRAVYAQSRLRLLPEVPPCQPLSRWRTHRART